MKFTKSVVSLRYDFCDLDIGCSNESTKDEILSVGPTQPEMIGLDVIVHCYGSNFCESNGFVYVSLGSLSKHDGDGSENVI